MLKSFTDSLFNDNGNKLLIAPESYSSLVLAYIGDAVYELFIRNKLVNKGNMKVNKLHKTATCYVKAEAQSYAIHKIEHKLTQKELAVYKRGRNAKSHTVPKNANINDYRCATGFEALVGYLYLKNDMERLLSILDMVYNNIKI